MPEYTLTRTGKPPLAFSGEILAHESTRQPKNVLHQRWHEITLYRTAGGRLVLQVDYHCERRPESGYYQAGPIGDISALAGLLEKYDPLEHVVGYPPGAQFESRQRVLLESLQSAYYQAVGRILTKCVEPERVD